MRLVRQLTRRKRCHVGAGQLWWLFRAEVTKLGLKQVLLGAWLSRFVTSFTNSMERTMSSIELWATGPKNRSFLAELEWLQLMLFLDKVYSWAKCFKDYYYDRQWQLLLRADFLLKNLLSTVIRNHSASAVSRCCWYGFKYQCWSIVLT